MSDLPYAQELQTAIQAVRAAARICLHVQSSMSSDALEKKDKSPVTIADYASQAVICQKIRSCFPDDPIVGEEDAAELRQPEQLSFLNQILQEIHDIGINASIEDVLSWIDAGNHDASAARYWTLDPIDGTKGFLRKEQFAVSLALLIEKQIQVAALGCPNLPGENGNGVLFYAVRGQGAWMQPLHQPEATPQTVRVTRSSDITTARMCESVESGHSAHDESAVIREKLGMTAPAVRMDSQAKYGAIARGDAEIYLRLPTRKGYEEKIWDHAGGVLVVEEAGGKVTDLNGAPLDFSVGPTLAKNRGVVVTNGDLHDVVLQALQATLS